jgi:pimeloyl-ACP methyl ester carboxylesterase
MSDPTTDPHARNPAPVLRREDVGELSFRIHSSRRPDASPTQVFVLVHGIGVSHRYLARLHRQLAERSDVHSIDLPGFGGLPKPAGQVPVPLMADALGVVLDRLGLAGAVLVGHSMGAQWVVELAVHRPDLASSVVVIGPVSDDLRRSVAAQSIALAVDTIGEPLDGNVIVFTDYLRCGPRWYLRQLRHMVTYPIENRVTALTCPLLIIRGGDDPIAGQAWTRRLRDHAPAGSLVMVPGHRHLVQHTAPRTVAHAITAFLADSRHSASPLWSATSGFARSTSAISSSGRGGIVSSTSSSGTLGSSGPGTCG